MKTRLVLLLLAGSCLGISCDPRVKSDDSVAAPASAPASTQVPPDPCDQLRGEFQTLLRAATTHCSKDDDCTCGPGGIAPAGCGRIMNKASADNLYKAYSQFRQRCDLDFHCAPESCLTACENGRCEQRPESTEVQPVLRPPAR